MHLIIFLHMDTFNLQCFKIKKGIFQDQFHCVQNNFQQLFFKYKLDVVVAFFSCSLKMILLFFIPATFAMMISFSDVMKTVCKFNMKNIRNNVAQGNNQLHIFHETMYANFLYTIFSIYCIHKCRFITLVNGSVILYSCEYVETEYM